MQTSLLGVCFPVQFLLRLLLLQRRRPQLLLPLVKQPFPGFVSSWRVTCLFGLFHILSFGCCWFFGRWLFFSRIIKLGSLKSKNNTGASSSVTPYVFANLRASSSGIHVPWKRPNPPWTFHVILVVLLFQDFRPFCFRKITTFQNLCSIDPVIFTPSHN